MTARLPTGLTADARRAGTRASATTASQPHRRATDDPRARARSTAVNDQGPPNTEESAR